MPAMGRWCESMRCIAAKAVAIGRVGDGGFRGASHAVGPHPCPLPEGEGVFFVMVGAVMIGEPSTQARTARHCGSGLARDGAAVRVGALHRGQARSHSSER